MIKIRSNRVFAIISVITYFRESCSRLQIPIIYHLVISNLYLPENLEAGPLLGGGALSQCGASQHPTYNYIGKPGLTGLGHSTSTTVRALYYN